MPPKVIKLGKKDDLGSVIKQIKSLRDREVLFVLEKGSPLLKQPQSIKIIRKAGEVLGKTIMIEGIDGIKATEVEIRPLSHKPKFSDIRVATRRVPAHPPVEPERIHHKLAVNTPDIEETEEEGSRYEVAVDRGGSSKFSKFFILFLVVLVIAVFGLAVLLPRADITVAARSEPITRDLELTVDKAVATPNLDTLQIPGMLVTDKETQQTKSFPTTGVKVSGEKASGVVTIYNFTANPLKLGSKTTTLLAGGKRFALVKDVAGIKPNGQQTQNVAIVAETGGTDYNLPAQTRFQIVNAALGSQNVYAINPAPLAGGTIGESTKVVSQQDLDQAADSLSKDIITEAEAELSQDSKTKMDLVESAVKKEVLAKTADKNVGDTADSFNMTLIARISGLAFRDDDVVSLVVSKINQVLSSDKYLLDSAQKSVTPIFKSVDLAKGSGILDVHFETLAAYKIDTADLVKILGGKNESEIKEILLSKPEVDKVDVKFWPAWFVHKAPRFNGKINIQVVTSQ